MLRIVGDLTLDDMYKHDAITGRLMEEIGVPLYVLVDVTQIAGFPMSLSDHYALWGRQMTPQIRLLVLYGIRIPLARLLANIISRVSRGRCQIVDTHDEAMRLIRRHKLTDSSSYMTV